jgi:hypothetical protein
MLNEETQRRPEFQAGIAVELADGQQWHFPVPRVRLAPVRTPGGAWAVGVGRSGLPEYAHWAEVLLGLTEADPEEYWRIRMTAAATLLCLNYDLEGDELAELLAFEPDAPDGPYTRRWMDIDAAVLGMVPKASPATSDSAAV